MTKRSITKQPQASEVLPPWADFGRVGKIQSWIEELKKIKESEPTSNDWRLLGRGVVVCHPVEELRTPLVEKIAQEAGYEYATLSAEDFFEWVHDGKALPNEKPTIFHVKQGVWSGTIDDDKKAAEELVTFQAKEIPKYLSALPTNLTAVFVVTAESYSDLEPPLRAVGAFDRRFDIAEFTLPELGAWFLNLISSELCDDSLFLDTGKVGKLINDEFDDRRRQRLIALHLQRLANRECRKVCFDDLVYFAVNGGSETEHAPEANAAMLHRVAVHEAGHALVSILDSNGRNIPDFASIVQGSHFKGFVTDSYAYSFALTGRYTYEDSRHKIRVQLAGRVAEAVALGPTHVGTFAARSDLRNATKWAKELVGKYGFSAEQENPNAIRDNLAVIEDEASASEAAHIEQQARLLLKRQYEAVEVMILENKALLDAITDALLERQVLNQADISAIFRNIQRGDAQAPLANRTSNFTPINPLLTKVVEHMTGEYTLDEQGIARSKLTAISDNVRAQLHACVTKHLLQHDHGIVVYALNKSPLLYAANLLATFSDLSLDRLIGNAKQTDAEFQKITFALGKLHEASVYFDDTHGLSSDKRLEGLFRLERTMGPTKLGAVICDRNELLDSRFQEYCARKDIEIVVLDQ